jgi:ABC-type branched-subunit amino acid transport system permease subunit
MFVKFLRQQFTQINAGLKTGIIFGIGLIFLTLIGIPSDNSEELAGITLPLFLLLSFALAWRAGRNMPLLGKALKNALALGIAASVVFLLFLGLINGWHADGIDVTGQYFNKMNLYPIQLLSGVPIEELFPNPDPDPLTGELAEGQSYRTNPMQLSFDKDYALVSVGGLHIGGFYGLAVLLIAAAGAGGLAQNLWRRVDWDRVRASARETLQSGSASSVLHWVILTLPLIFFALFWLTLPLGKDKDATQIVNLSKVFKLTSSSLISDVTIQLGIVFLIIIGGIVAVRQATVKEISLNYAARVGILLALVGLTFLLVLWRVQVYEVSFFAPSFDFVGLSGHDYSNIALFLGMFAVVAYVLSTSQNPERYEFVYASTLAAVCILASPLYMDQYQTFILGRIGLMVMFGLGLNIVVGYAGLLDLGYVAFYAIGAYTFAFLAVENDRSKVSVDALNRMGWLILSVFIVAPIVLFITTNLWKNRGVIQERKKVHTRIQHQSRVWENQPVWWIGLLMVAVAVLTSVLFKELMEAVGLFQANQFSSFLIAIVVAMLVAAFTGILLGIPVLRLRGDYLAIVTLGFGEIISLGLKNLDSITGGPSGAIGVPKPVAAGTPQVTTNLIMLYLSVLGAVMIAMLSVRLRHSRLGRAWMAMHSDEDIAQAMGINLINVKLLAFSVGASFAGLAGMIFASRQNSIFPDDFGLEISINVLALVIIGGMGSIPGVIVGAIALIGLPEMLRPVADYRIMSFGLLLIVSMVTLPAGLMPTPPPQLEAEAKRLAEEEDNTKGGELNVNKERKS